MRIDLPAPLTPLQYEWTLPFIGGNAAVGQGSWLCKQMVGWVSLLPHPVSQVFLYRAQQ